MDSYMCNCLFFSCSELSIFLMFRIMDSFYLRCLGGGGHTVDCRRTHYRTQNYSVPGVHKTYQISVCLNCQSFGTNRLEEITELSLC